MVKKRKSKKIIIITLVSLFLIIGIFILAKLYSLGSLQTFFIFPVENEGLQTINFEVDQITGNYEILYGLSKDAIYNQERADLVHIDGVIYVDGIPSKSISETISSDSYSFSKGKLENVKINSDVTFLAKVIRGVGEGKTSSIVRVFTYKVETNCGGKYVSYPLGTYLYNSEVSLFNNLMNNYNGNELPIRDNIDCGLSAGNIYVISPTDILLKTDFKKYSDYNLNITDVGESNSEQYVNVYDSDNSCELVSIKLNEISENHYNTLGQCENSMVEEIPEDIPEAELNFFQFIWKGIKDFFSTIGNLFSK